MLLFLLLLLIETILLGLVKFNYYFSPDLLGKTTIPGILILSSILLIAVYFSYQIICRLRKKENSWDIVMILQEKLVG